MSPALVLALSDNFTTATQDRLDRWSRTEAKLERQAAARAKRVARQAPAVDVEADPQSLRFE